MVCDYLKRKPIMDGFISMHDLDTDVEYSFFFNSEKLKKNPNVPQISYKNLEKTSNKNLNKKKELYTETVSNRFSEINESSINFYDQTEDI